MLLKPPLTATSMRLSGDTIIFSGMSLMRTWVAGGRHPPAAVQQILPRQHARACAHLRRVKILVCQSGGARRLREERVHGGGKQE